MFQSNPAVKTDGFRLEELLAADVLEDGLTRVSHVRAHGRTEKKEGANALSLFTES